MLSRALTAGALTLDDAVESLVPEIGLGFRGRTVGDVAAMAVNHNVAELAAYTGDEDAKAMFDRGKRSGRRNVKRLLAEADDIKAGRAKNNRPPLTTTELLDRALRTEFGDQISPARRDEQKLRDHQGRFSPRPTRSDNGKAVDPDVQMKKDFDKVWDKIEKRNRT